MPDKPRRRGAVMALLAPVIVTFLLALPGIASAGPLGEATFYDEGLRSAAEIDYTTEGPDGNVWFVDHTSLSSSVAGFGKITPAGTITEYICGETLSGCNPEARPTGITPGPEGDTHLWFTDRGTNDPSSPPSIGRIDSESPGTVEEFSIEAEGGHAESTPQGIVAGPEGNLWFTDVHKPHGIGVFDPSAPEGERVEEFSEAAGLQAGARPRGIVVGSDGALWFTDTGRPISSIGRIDPSTHVIEEFPLHYGARPGGTESSVEKSGIVAGPDGDVWFTENKETSPGICKIEVAEPHEIECFSEGLLAPTGVESGPRTLAVAEGRLWFTEHSDRNETQLFSFESAEGETWEEGDEFELCNEDESICATGAFKATATDNRHEVGSALEAIYGAGNISPSSGPNNVRVSFVGELAGVDIGQASCRKLSGSGVGCSVSTEADGRFDSISRINKYGEIVRHPIEGLTGVSSITSSGGDVWFPATSNGVKSIGKFGVEITEFPLTAKIQEGEGTVVSDPAGITCTGSAGEECTAELEEGQEVTLTASPAAGYRFFSWGLCPSAEGRQCTVTMSEATEVRAKFKKTYDLTIDKGGSQRGVVLNSKNGVTCAVRCSTSTISLFEGAEVTIYTASPFGNTYMKEFTGGTGSTASCDGTAECTFTLEEDSSAEALFEERPKATLSIEKEGGGEAKLEGNGTFCNNSCESQQVEYFSAPTAQEAWVRWNLAEGTHSLEWTTGAGTCTGLHIGGTGICWVTMDEDHELVAKLE